MRHSVFQSDGNSISIILKRHMSYICSRGRVPSSFLIYWRSCDSGIYSECYPLDLRYCSIYTMAEFGACCDILC